MTDESYIDDSGLISEKIEIFNETAKNIKQQIINFGKDGRNRKANPSYYTNKSAVFSSLYDELRDNFNEIIILNPEKDNVFFSSSLGDIYTFPETFLTEAKNHLDMLNTECFRASKPAKNFAAHIIQSLTPTKRNSAATTSNYDSPNDSDIETLKRENNDLTLKLSELFIQLESAKSELTDLKQANRDLRMSNHKLKLEALQGNTYSENNLDNCNPLANYTFPKRNKITDIIKLIPKFNGKPDELRVYLNKIDDLFSYIHDNEEALFVTVVKTNLTGEAATEVAEEEGLDTWNDLKTKLLTSFKQKENHVNDIARLQQMKQGPNENVENFCNRVKIILIKLKSVIPTGATRSFWFAHTERYATQCLEDGLSDVSISARLVSEKPKTFQAAIQFVIDTECRLKKNQIQVDATNFNAKQNIHATAPQVTMCTFCNKKGHQFSNCRIRIKNAPTDNPISTKTYRCDICETDTHTTAICYKNPKNNKSPDTNSNDKETVHTISVEPAAQSESYADTWLESEN